MDSRFSRLPKFTRFIDNFISTICGRWVVSCIKVDLREVPLSGEMFTFRNDLSDRWQNLSRGLIKWLCNDALCTIMGSSFVSSKAYLLKVPLGRERTNGVGWIGWRNTAKIFRKDDQTTTVSLDYAKLRVVFFFKNKLTSWYCSKWRSIRIRSGNR